MMSSIKDIPVTLLKDSKDTYTKRLCDYLHKPIYQGLNSIWNESKKMAENPESPSPYRNFQTRLSTVHKWNQDIIDNEYDRIVEVSGFKAYDNLITAIFYHHAKILSVAKIDNTDKKLNLKVPNSKKFIHKCYIECAREFWLNPMLFEDRTGKDALANKSSKDIMISSNDFNTNYKECMKTIVKCINDAIIVMLPMEDILENYIGSTADAEDNASIASHDSLANYNDMSSGSSDNESEPEMPPPIENDFIQNPSKALHYLPGEGPPPQQYVPQQSHNIDQIMTPNISDTEQGPPPHVPQLPPKIKHINIKPGNQAVSFFDDADSS